MFLDDSELKLLAQSWDVVIKDKSAYGGLFFVHLFTIHPEVQEKHFPVFRMDDMSTLSWHGSRVLEAFNDVMQAMLEKDEEKMGERLREITLSHYKKSIKGPQYLVFQNVLLDFLNLSFGNQLSQELVEVWKKVLKEFYSIVSNEIDRLAELEEAGESAA